MQPRLLVSGETAATLRLRGKNLDRALGQRNGAFIQVGMHPATYFISNDEVEVSNLGSWSQECSPVSVKEVTLEYSDGPALIPL